MKKMLVVPLALGLLVGCSSTPYVDKEFGQATRTAFETQIADQTYRHAEQTPEGLEGIVAEEVMTVYTDDFGQAPTDAKIIQPVITTSNQ
jgi:hypothetical protein